MKKLSFLFLFIVFSLLLSCNNKTTAPETTVSALDNIKKLAGKYSGIKQGEYYNNVTIKDDGSLFVEYNNGDGTGDQTLNIVPDKITESQENAYNFHYTAQDGTGEKRFVTLISYDTRFIKLIGWQTKSSGFLCNEKNINDLRGKAPLHNDDHNGNSFQNTKDPHPPKGDCGSPTIRCGTIPGSAGYGQAKTPLK